MRTGAASQVNRLYAKLSHGMAFGNASNPLAHARNTSILQAFLPHRESNTNEFADSAPCGEYLVKILLSIVFHYRIALFHIGSRSSSLTGRRERPVTIQRCWMTKVP